MFSSYHHHFQSAQKKLLFFHISLKKIFFYLVCLCECFRRILNTYIGRTKENLSCYYGNNIFNKYLYDNCIDTADDYSGRRRESEFAIYIANSATKRNWYIVRKRAAAAAASNNKNKTHNISTLIFVIFVVVVMIVAVV